MQKTIQSGVRKGLINIPSSKSYMQRALLGAALSKGKSIITNPGQSNDNESMLEFIQLLGASYSQKNDSYQIEGLSSAPQKLNINMGESGLGIRLITSVLACLGGDYEINGEGSLRSRPMDEFEQLFDNHGISISTTNGLVPIHLKGKLEAGDYYLNGNLSSQFVSGVLMGLPLLDADSILHVKDLKSIPYVKMTLNLLEEFGIYVHNNDYTTFEIKGNQSYQASEIEIEGDWSSASFWLVASALGHDIQIAGLNMNSVQADRTIITALENAGCEIWINDGIISCSEAKNPFSFDATDAPDLFPALVTLAAFMEGKSTILGAERLVHKESHRGLVLQEEFGKLGLKIDIEGDLMHIHGTGNLSGGTVSSNNDHRIAMTLAIAGMSAENEITITGSEAVKKSYPSFWEQLEQLELQED